MSADIAAFSLPGPDEDDDTYNFWEATGGRATITMDGLLPTPPGGCAAFAPGLEADCDTLLAARDTLAGDATLNWSPHTSMADWDGVTVAGSPPRVTRLRLAQMGLAGTIPAELGNLSSLTGLDLQGNQLTGTIPAELGNLSSLTGLDLQGNQLTGTIPAELGDLVSLQRLSLWSNQLSGEIPQAITRLTRLWDFWFLNNPELCAPVDNAFQAWLQSIDNAVGSSCAPTDSAEDRAVLVEFYNATGGTNWTNNDNWLSDRPIREWRDVANDANGRVTVLHMENNSRLSGSLPPALGRLSNLKRLELSHSLLTGPIPSELGNLSNLEWLGLRSNQLTGSIPPELGGLVNLRDLYLDGNQLRGEIPSELGNLTNLRTLWLYENQLRGEIPSELGNLTNLQTLRLNENQLRGEIPSELGNLTKLYSLYLGGNQLTGCVPYGLRGTGEMTSRHLACRSAILLNLRGPGRAGRVLQRHRRSQLDEQHQLAQRRTDQRVVWRHGQCSGKCHTASSE